MAQYGGYDEYDEDRFDVEEQGRGWGDDFMNNAAQAFNDATDGWQGDSQDEKDEQAVLDGDKGWGRSGPDEEKEYYEIGDPANVREDPRDYWMVGGIVRGFDKDGRCKVQLGRNNRGELAEAKVYAYQQWNLSLAAGNKARDALNNVTEGAQNAVNATKKHLNELAICCKNQASGKGCLTLDHSINPTKLDAQRRGDLRKLVQKAKPSKALEKALDKIIDCIDLEDDFVEKVALSDDMLGVTTYLLQRSLVSCRSSPETGKSLRDGNREHSRCCCARLCDPGEMDYTGTWRENVHVCAPFFFFCIYVVLYGLCITIQYYLVLGLLMERTSMGTCSSMQCNTKFVPDNDGTTPVAAPLFGVLDGEMTWDAWLICDRSVWAAGVAVVFAVFASMTDRLWAGKYLGSIIIHFYTLIGVGADMAMQVWVMVAAGRMLACAQNTYEMIENVVAIFFILNLDNWIGKAVSSFLYNSGTVTDPDLVILINRPNNAAYLNNAWRCACCAKEPELDDPKKQSVYENAVSMMECKSCRRVEQITDGRPRYENCCVWFIRCIFVRLGLLASFAIGMWQMFTFIDMAYNSRYVVNGENYLDHPAYDSSAFDSIDAAN